MYNATDIANAYITLWNETDTTRRNQILIDNWSDAAVYADPIAKAHGRQEIAAMIAGVRERFPDFRFTLNNTPNGHGDHVRFSWSLGPPGVEAPIEGSDVIVMKDGRIGQVIGFIDKAPPSA